MSDSSDKTENEQIKTRTQLRKIMLKQKSKNLFLYFFSIVIFTISAIILYKIIFKSNFQLSLQITYASIICSLCFLYVIMLLRIRKVQPDNHYYQYLFMLFSTILGFTFSTSFQEYLKEREEKQELTTMLKISIDYYEELSFGTTPIVLNPEIFDKKEQWYSSPEDFRDSFASTSYRLKDSREPMLNIAYNEPQKFKSLSTELQMYLGSAVPMSTYYEEFATSWHATIEEVPEPGFRAEKIYLRYGIMAAKLQTREKMLQAELDRLNGDLSSQAFKRQVAIIKNKEDELLSLDTPAEVSELQMISDYFNSLSPGEE